MKKTFLLIAACVFACASVQAQNSEVETAIQLTKAEQFKERNSLIKEAEIYKHVEGGVKMFAKLFTDLNSGDKLAALAFYSTATFEEKLGSVMMGAGVISDQPLGYLDMDQVDDFLLVLERILDEDKKSAKKDKYTITYTTQGGIDICFTTGLKGELTPVVILRKKWFAIDDYGAQTANYSSTYCKLAIKELPKLISSIKEAQTIVNQSVIK